MSLASNIRLYRKKAGLTQIRLAEDMGVSIATLRRWEAGETAPTGTRIKELAERLGTAPEDIVMSENVNNVNNEQKTDSGSRRNNNGMLVFEDGGTRVELPPTDKGYEIFNHLVEHLINNKRIGS